MIVGLGVDIADVERIERLLDKHRDRFVRRICTEREAAQFESDVQMAQHLAGRFAAKEAVFKALGTGWSSGIGWHQVEVLNDDSGKPVLHISGAAKERAERLGAAKWLLSISHIPAYAVAVAIAETAAGS